MIIVHRAILKQVTLVKTNDSIHFHLEYISFFFLAERAQKRLAVRAGPTEQTSTSIPSFLHSFFSFFPSFLLCFSFFLSRKKKYLCFFFYFFQLFAIAARREAADGYSSRGHGRLPPHSKGPHQPCPVLCLFPRRLAPCHQLR